MASDFTSPFAHAGDQGLEFINSDVTVYLHREPRTRVGRLRSDRPRSHRRGVPLAACRLYDEDGPIGTSTVAALAQRKPMTNVPPP